MQFEFQGIGKTTITLINKENTVLAIIDAKLYSFCTLSPKHKDSIPHIVIVVQKTYFFTPLISNPIYYFAYNICKFFFIGHLHTHANTLSIKRVCIEN